MVRKKLDAERTFYDRSLIEAAKVIIVHEEKPKKTPKHGGKTIEWVRFETLPEEVRKKLCKEKQ